jgi:hypothetical protein
MIIRFVDNKVDNMSAYVNPEATFIPPHELKEPETRLKGFNWREAERPTLTSILTPAPKSDQEEEEIDEPEVGIEPMVPVDNNK